MVSARKPAGGQPVFATHCGVAGVVVEKFSGSMRRVLIVDDEENLRLVVRTFLKRDGYEVEVASGVEEALGLIDSFGPDFILTDVRMPELGGLDWLATLKAKGDPATVIVMSAYGNVDLAIEAMKAG